MKYILIAIAAIVIIAGGYWAYRQLMPKVSDMGMQQEHMQATSTDTNYPTPIADVNYSCDAGKTIHAVYFADYVIVDLSDGRAAKLPQTISASGARYANSDESMVFWNKGTTAFVQDGGDTTFANCAQIATDQTASTTAQ